MEDEAAAAAGMITRGTVRVRSGLESSSGVSSLGLFSGCSTPSSSETQALDWEVEVGIHGEAVAGEEDLAATIHRLRTAAIRAQSNQLVRPELANRDGDLDSGPERWEVRQQATWQAIEGNLNGQETTNPLALCGVTITMEREAQLGEMAGGQDRRVRVRRFHPQDMRVQGLGPQAEGSRGITH